MERLLIEKIIHLSVCRRSGRTTALSLATKSIRGTLICANKVHANMVSKQFEVDTVSVDQELIGVTRTLIYDHFTVEKAAYEAWAEIQSLKKELKLTRETVKKAYRLGQIAMQCDAAVICMAPVKLKIKAADKNYALGKKHAAHNVMALDASLATEAQVDIMVNETKNEIYLNQT